MVASRIALGCCAAAGFLNLAAGQDTVSLLQQGVSEHAELSASLLGKDLSHFIEDGRAARVGNAGRKMFGKMDELAPKAKLAEMGHAVKKIGQEAKETLAKGWRAFAERSRRSKNPNPRELLHNGKLALIQSGAMAEMKRLARVSANASRGIYLGSVPLDSMMIGFRTSMAPWNNILKLFKIPLIKSQFTIFTNFFGPDGNAARLCIGAATAVDSEYGVHARSEFSGINIFIGPAKWDNVPGWSFGSSGGYDNVRIMDVADFGWTWTLAREPETVCFFYDVCIIDDEELHANMLQMSSQVETAGPGSVLESADGSKPLNLASLERHGSTWLQHIWCSPNWFNTPLVLPDVVSSGSTMKEATEKDGKDAAAEAPYFKAAEEWDPESEAV